MKPVRLHGDPFGRGAAAVALRACLQLCCERGFAASLCLSSVRPEEGAGSAVVELGDGARRFAVRTDLPAAVIAQLQAAVATPVPATAPVLVFAKRRWRADAVALAGLEWPRACTVLDGCGAFADEVLVRVEAALRWAGIEDPAIAALPDRLAAWAALPAPPPTGCVLHVTTGQHEDGSDVAVRAFFAANNTAGRRLRIVMPPRDEVAAARLSTLVNECAGVPGLERLELVLAHLRPLHAADSSVILQPLRRLPAGDLLPQLLASGRPVVATRYFATAPAVGAPGVCLPVGGTIARGADGLPFCEPDLDNVRLALQRALGDAGEAQQVGLRGRSHALVELVRGQPAAPPSRPAQPRRRPVVVLEAPFLEVSSAAELSLATAQALVRRNEVDVRLVANGTFRQSLAQLRARAPELATRLVRDGGTPELWLSSGWPPRSERPRCRTFAVRLDWEYGALPTELSPLVTHEADVVVVHSRHVERTVTAAGTPAQRVVRVPHGVDGEAFHEQAAGDAEVLGWKNGLPAVLFVGGLVFRKGFDLWLRMALDAARAGARFVLVVKAIGHDQHYRGFHLADLAQRFRVTAGAPPMLLIDGDVERARLPGIFRACDLLNHPYRGEGFGMPVLEARACGLPVLVTAGGATDDFATGPGVIALPASRRAVDLPGAHLGQPWLLEPDVVAAGALLRQALAALPELTAVARTAAPAVRAAHRWDGAAAAIEALARGTAAMVAPSPPFSPCAARAHTVERTEACPAPQGTS